MIYILADVLKAVPTAGRWAPGTVPRWAGETASTMAAILAVPTGLGAGLLGRRLVGLVKWRQ